MRLFYQNKNILILIPLVAILIVGIYLISFGITDPGTSLILLIHSITMTAGIWMGCMSIVLFLWKKFPWEQTPLFHLIIEISLILTYTILFGLGLYALERKFWNIPEINNPGMEIFITVLITFLITAIHESVFFYQQWKYNFSKSLRLEKDNLEARYETLRSQINPHFLFNSLNSLTMMAEGNKRIEDYVQNLSGLLRYMINGSDTRLVMVKDEISVLNKYIELQKMRFPNVLDIKMEVPENYYHYAIPPLVLQMVAENCFKHNSVSKEHPLKIEIKAENEVISVTNNLQKKSAVTSTGQGLKNISERYKFFTSKQIEVKESKTHFKVTLPLLQIEL